MKKMTDRLEAVFTLIPRAETIADIGTDHGYLAVELVARSRAKKAIAGDVNKGPLASAKAYVATTEVAEDIDCRLGNGLQVVQKGELQGAVICGMGGFLMRDIIDAGPEMLDFYVLQPQNGQAELRQYIVAKGYRIVHEVIMTDMGKLYQAFLAVKKGRETAYVTTDGPVTQVLLDERDPYENLSEKSMLWTVGALVQREKPKLWQEHMNHLIHMREVALEGMSETLAHTEKYQMLAAEVKELKELV